MQNQNITENVSNFSDEAKFDYGVLHKLMKIVYFILKHRNIIRFFFHYYDMP